MNGPCETSKVSLGSSLETTRNTNPTAMSVDLTTIEIAVTVEQHTNEDVDSQIESDIERERSDEKTGQEM
ncbi:unnamed protein product [Peniophora sp. CBMAI 1063]|nr:unnamed protein product [Peniophora sp. CBMAI 1063]